MTHLATLRLVVRRVLYGAFILFGVNLATFALFFAVNTPDDMARLNIGGKRVTAEQIQKWKAERGYDKPLIYDAQGKGVQRVTHTIFWDRSISLFALDFGRADSSGGGDIGHQILTRAGVSLRLTVPLFILGMLASLSLALLLVFFRGTRLDFWAGVACIVMMSISSMFYIILGQYFFSRQWHLAPISGFASGWGIMRFVLLPIALALLANLGGGARLYRAILLEESGKDYVRTARAKGLSGLRVLWRHVLPNAMLPVLTTLGGTLPYLFMGSLVFESFFGLPGLGAYTVEAISAQDFAVVRSMVFIGAALYIASNTLIDILYTVADPRVRLE